MHDTAGVLLCRASMSRGIQLTRAMGDCAEDKGTIHAAAVQAGSGQWTMAKLHKQFKFERSTKIEHSFISLAE